MEILRFGPGFRRAQAPAGTHGVAEQIIWADPRASVTELAFGPRAVLPPQSSPQHGLLVVVSGGGWVQVGEERAPVHHGEAVPWPPFVAHGAWTDGTHMRALLIEVPDEPVSGPFVPPVAVRAMASVTLGELQAAPGQPGATTPASGGLAERTGRPEEHDPTEGEPW